MTQHIISIVNQKGGVGKTASSVNLAACFAHLKKKTLLIDLDYQANASSYFGIKIDAKKENRSISSALMKKKAFQDVIFKTADKNLDIIAADMGLIEITIEKSLIPGSIFMLKKLLQQEAKEYDIIILDTRPSIDLLFSISLAAADTYLLPIFPEADPFDGLQIVFDQVMQIQDSSVNPDLNFLGILITKYDAKNSTHKKFLPLIKDFAQENKIKINGIIPNTTAIAGSSSSQKPLIWYNPTLDVTKAYLQIAKNLITDLKNLKPEKFKGAVSKKIKTPSAIIDLFSQAQGVVEL
jgi:chromosome partitioning protein